MTREQLMSKPATLSKLMVVGLLGSKASLSTVSSPALIGSGRTSAVR